MKIGDTLNRDLTVFFLSFSQSWPLRGADQSQSGQLPERRPGGPEGEALGESDGQWDGLGQLCHQVPVGHGKVPHQAES